MKTISLPSGGVYHELSETEGKELFNKQCQGLLGISGEEFLRRYEFGDIVNDDTDTRITRLVMLVPLALVEE